MKTTVYQQNYRQNQLTGDTVILLNETQEKINPCLTKQLHQYSQQRLNAIGFTQAANWEPEIYTTDGERNLSDRRYTVRFQNSNRGYIEIVGIRLIKGKPALDHGLAIGEDG